MKKSRWTIHHTTTLVSFLTGLDCLVLSSQEAAASARAERKAQDDSQLPQWDPLKREPWMRIAKRDPPPGYGPGDFDNEDRRIRAQAKAQGLPVPDSQGNTKAESPNKQTPNEPWLRAKIRQNNPWERESWFAIAKRDPPPIVYTAPKRPEKPSIKSEVEKAQEDAKKKIDRMMRQERNGQAAIVERPLELPAFLRREKWSAIAKRDPPPTLRNR